MRETVYRIKLRYLTDIVRTVIVGFVSLAGDKALMRRVNSDVECFLRASERYLDL